MIPIFCILTLAGCGGRSDTVVTGRYYNPVNETAEESTLQAAGQENVPEAAETTELAGEQQAQTSLGSDLFMITTNDMQSECLILEQLASGKQYMYNYSIATRFLDKYGNRTTVSYFEPGRIICVGEKDIQGRLLEAQVSDAAWEYPDVTRYSYDEERGVFTIADTNYSYADGLFINSDGNMLTLSDLTAMDTLRVIGIDKEIYSISVTTGHGDLKLTNTSLFDGSYIQIGSKIFSEITGEMSLEIPEGTYTVAVANNGWGGSTEVTIVRGQETVLDLDTLKGEGPKFGSILFAVDVEGAILQIDGKVVDYSSPVDVQYGVHTLTVTADSYDTYSKKLYVNSKEATIVIGMTGSETSSGSDTSADASETDTDSSNDADTTGETGVAGSLAGSLAGSYSAGSTGSTGSTGTSGTGSVTNATSEAELNAIVDELLEEDGEETTSDYLSTIVEALLDLKDD